MLPHPRRRPALVAAIFLVSALVGACGGDSSSGETGQTLGGTVSGLVEGTTLVLGDGAGGTVAVTADGAFAFLTPLARGTAYDVTVVAQPTDPAQSCAVANGTGTIRADDVSDVAVSCELVTWAVDVSVTGLVGDGLVVSLDGDEELTLDGDGGTFETRVADGVPFTVTIISQPTSPSQTCAVDAPAAAYGADAAVTITCATDAHTLGGTLSGLVTGTELVLADGLGQTLTLSHDGAFTFPNALPSGATYDVVVETAPEGPVQDCTVDNGAGTVVDADVDDLEVTCAVHPFSVSVTVSNLLGDGLTVALDGGDTLALDASGGTFTTTVPDGDGWRVFVGAHPTDPIQRCVFADDDDTASGTMSGADVTLELTCGPPMYLVGGTVDAFAGDALTLSLATGETLTVDAPGPFTFETAHADDAGYEVTVVYAGDRVLQDCTVENASGTIDGADVDDVTVSCAATTVSAAVPTAPDWNDYAAADDTAVDCDPDAEPAGYLRCVHGGERRTFVVPAALVSDCADLDAADDAGALDWACDDAGGEVRFTSTGLAAGARLSDLLDFDSDALGWAPRSVTVSRHDVAIGHTAATIWWDNPVVAAPAADGDGEVRVDEPGTVYVATEDAAYVLAADRVALVVPPGTTLMGPLGAAPVVASDEVAFAWLEGAFSADADHAGPALFDLTLSVLRGVTVTGGAQGYAALFISDTADCLLTDVEVSDAADAGLLLVASDFTTLFDIDIARVGGDGLTLGGCADTVVAGLTVESVGEDGVDIEDGARNTLSDVTIEGGDSDGFEVQGEEDLTLLATTVTGVESEGVDIEASSGVTLSAVVTQDTDGAGIYLHDGVFGVAIEDVVCDGAVDSPGAFLDVVGDVVIDGLSATGNGDSGLWILDCDVCDIRDVQAHGNAWMGVELDTITELTVTDVEGSGNDYPGVALFECTAPVVSGVTAEGNADVGYLLAGVVGGTSSDIAVADNDGPGVLFDYTSEATLTDVRCVDNEEAGLILDSSRDNRVFGVTVANVFSDGVALYQSANNVLAGLSVTSADDDGIAVVESPNNVVLGATVAHSGDSPSDAGLGVYDSDDNTLLSVAATLGFIGVEVDGGAGNAFDQLVSSGNILGFYTGAVLDASFGVISLGRNSVADCLYDPASGDVTAGCASAAFAPAGGTLVSDVDASGAFVGEVTSDGTNTTITTGGQATHAALSDRLGFDNAWRGWGKAFSAQEVYTFEDGQVPAGWTNDSAQPWVVDAAVGSEFSDGSHSLSVSPAAGSTSCVSVPHGANGVLVSALVVGDAGATLEITVDGAVIGTAISPVDGWVSFGDELDAGSPDVVVCVAVPDGGAATTAWLDDVHLVRETDCEDGEQCQIVDLRLAAGDATLLGAHGAPTGDDVVTHAFGECTLPGAPSPDECASLLTEQWQTLPIGETFLRDAVEVLGDDIGDDDLLCESDETCVFAPNIGGYQGEGELVTLTTIGAGGAVENVTLLTRSVNGAQ